MSEVRHRLAVKVLLLTAQMGAAYGVFRSTMGPGSCAGGREQAHNRQGWAGSPQGRRRCSSRPAGAGISGDLSAVAVITAHRLIFTVSLPCGGLVTVREAGMATKVTVTLEDDLDGGAADETLRFRVGGTEYEIDLNTTNARAFRKQLAPLIEHARRAGRGQRRAAAHTASARGRSGEIRAWAKEQGIAVSGRGRIPASVVEEYEAAAKGR
jgi:hypothetical protein